MPQLKRWVPLIGVAVIATSTILRAWDLAGPAAALDSLAGALGITSASPVGAGELTAAAAALAGVVIKVYSVISNPKK